MHRPRKLECLCTGHGLPGAALRIPDGLQLEQALVFLKRTFEVTLQRGSKKLRAGNLGAAGPEVNLMPWVPS